MTRPVKCVGVLLTLMMPAGVWALGLGDINLRSALGQPMDADIELIQATWDELPSLRVTVASLETFERYGIDRPGFLSSLSFSVQLDDQGRNVISVNSSQPITEPFVTFLVEANWARGRLLREYTVLLDPPVLIPQPEAAAPVAAVAAPRSGSSQRVQRQTQTPRATPAPATSGRAFDAPSARRSADSYTVRRRDTLWGIASQFRADDSITMNQMMIAVYEANPEAFDGNINRLKAGVVLRIPEDSGIVSRSAQSATAEVRRHNQAWRTASPAPQLVLVEPSDSGTADPGVATSQSGAAASGETAALRAEVDRLRQEVEESRRLIEIKDAELRDLAEQLAEQQTSPEAEPAPAPDAGQPGVDLESDSSLDDIFVEDSAPEPEPAVVEPEPVAAEPTAEAPPPAGVVTTRVREESLLDKSLGFLSNYWLYFLGALVLIVGLIAYGARRRQTFDDVTGRWEALEADEDEATREATSRLRSLVDEDESMVVVETAGGETTSEIKTEDVLGEATFTEETEGSLEDTLSNETAINLDRADPIAEADFHMAYGLYDQAADLIKQASDVEPENRDLKLKLLEIFFVWGNKESFVEEAQRFHADLAGPNDADWDKILIMGKQICPDEELFAGTAAAAADIDLDLAGVPDDAVELDISGDGADMLDLDIGEVDVGIEEVERIGEQTAGDIEEALAFDLEATGEAEVLVEEEDASPTQETPTVEMPAAADTDAPTIEMPAADADDDSPTAETPALGSFAMDSPTVEMEGVDEPTVETPAIDVPAGESPTTELPSLKAQIDSALESEGETDHTAEIELDDLGLDLDGLDASTESSFDDVLDGESEDFLAATGETHVLDPATVGLDSDLADDEETMLAPSIDSDSTGITKIEEGFALTAVLPGSPGDTEGTAEVSALSEELFDLNLDDDADSGPDVNLDDLTVALNADPSLGDTVEQPGTGDATTFSDAVFSPSTEDTTVAGSGLDMNVGEDAYAGDDAPTSTEEARVVSEAQTLTEVGTKLDLARAYVDMGDPEGARSILEEVLHEGDPGQKDEAQQILDSLSA